MLTEFIVHIDITSYQKYFEEEMSDDEDEAINVNILEHSLDAHDNRLNGH